MNSNAINECSEYFIHSNYSRPYKVIIQNNSHITVYKLSDEAGLNYGCLVLSANPQKIFIGKSFLCNMTEFSGGYGDDFDGNSILLQLSETSYIYVGEKVIMFNTLSPIVSYVSPVGNNDVPYPYAIDAESNYYLIIENVMISPTIQLANFLTNGETPYDFYYAASKITVDLGTGSKPLFENIFDIKKFYIGKESYSLIYVFNPAEYYDRLVSSLGNHLYVRNSANNKYEFTKQLYIELMEDFGKNIGVTKLTNVQVLDSITI
jgi:hypothetical protein